MLWYVNVILGFLIGSFIATYSERYRDMFRGILGALAKKNKPEEKTQKQKNKRS